MTTGNVRAEWSISVDELRQEIARLTERCDAYREALETAHKEALRKFEGGGHFSQSVQSLNRIAETCRVALASPPPPRAKGQDPMSIVSPRAGASVSPDWKMPEGLKGVLFLVEEMKATGSWHIPTLNRLAEIVGALAAGEQKDKTT